MKILADIKFIKPCITKHIIPTFAKVRLSLKHNNYKLKLHTARLIIETEMQNKHFEKKKLKKDMKRIGIQLKDSLGLILYNALIYHINKAVNSRLKVISLRHNNKLIRLLEQQNKQRKDEQKKLHQQIVHKYSTYNTLSDEQYETLSSGLDTHIPVKVNKNATYTESDIFFQRLLKDISNIPENELRQIKVNLRNTCDKYTKIKVQYKYRKVVKELSERKDIAILKADKDRGTAIMNRDKYTEKCLQILNTNQFVKFNSDPTKTKERKVQNILRKIKS